MGIPRTRREFLGDVGRGALIAALGHGAAADLGLADAFAADADGDATGRLDFGAREPLVALLQETTVDRLIPTLVGELRGGTPLRELVAAAALANARTFGGEDYVGYHTLMALAPAYHMAGEMPEGRGPLPVLKVLYRNTSRIHDFGGPSREVLRPVAPADLSRGDAPGGEALRAAVRRKSMDEAEATFAAIAGRGADEAFNGVLFAVQDNTEVHRTVLPYRAWDLLGLIGRDQAHTLLRQSVRYCVVSERDWQHTAAIDRPRVVLPKLFDEYRLDGRAPGRTPADDARVEALSRAFFDGDPDQAAEAAAAALAEGLDPSAVGEAITLAANQLVLRDAGRTAREVQPGKPLGSVHGDSIGVHACDSANAWRHMAAASNPRNTFACLILGAYQVAHDRVNRGGDFLHWAPRPLAEDLDAVRDLAEGSLREALHEAIRSNDQARACALVARLGDAGADPDDVFSALLGYAVSEDGALHAEKFYRTVREEFRDTRPAFRWRHLVALARVTASEHGRPAPGYAEAVDRLRA